MEDFDSIELFSDSMKKAASAAKQLAKLTKNKAWLGIAQGFENLRMNGEKIYRNPAPNQVERIRIVDNLVDRMATGQTTKTVQ